MSLGICPADIGHSFQSCAFGETVLPHFVLEERPSIASVVPEARGRTSRSGTCLRIANGAIRKIPEIEFGSCTYIFTAKRTLLKGEWREPHVWIINYKRPLNGIYRHYGNEL